MTSQPVTLGEVCSLVNGKAYNAHDWSTEGLPIIRIQNLNGIDKPFNYWNGSPDKEVHVSNGDILLAWSGTPGTSFGAHIWRRGRGVLNQHIFRLDIDRKRIIPEWAVTCINYQLHRLIRQAHGGVGLQHVTKPMVQALQMPLPPLSAQRRMINILGRADAIRQKKTECIRLTEELSHSTFLEMFGDPPTTSAKPLVDLAEVVSGITKGRNLNGRAVKVPYLRVANVQDGFLNLDEIKTIDALPDEVKSLSLQTGDIVMTEGGDHDKLGRGAVWNGAVPNCIHQNHVFRVRVDRHYLLPSYFAAFLRTPLAKRYFLRCAKKTTNLASINMTQLRGLPVPVPSLALQRKFEEVAKAINELAAIRSKAASDAVSLFGSLVQRAFREEL